MRRESFRLDFPSMACIETKTIRFPRTTVYHIASSANIIKYTATTLLFFITISSWHWRGTRTLSLRILIGQARAMSLTPENNITLTVVGAVRNCILMGDDTPWNKTKTTERQTRRRRRRRSVRIYLRARTRHNRDIVILYGRLWYCCAAVIIEP